MSTGLWAEASGRAYSALGASAGGTGAGEGAGAGAGAGTGTCVDGEPDTEGADAGWDGAAIVSC